MKKFFLILMVLLLPVRAWTAQGVVHASDYQIAATKLAVSVAATAAKAEMHDHHGCLTAIHADASHAAADSGTHAQHKDCKPCAACLSLAATGVVQQLTQVSRPDCVPPFQAAKLVSVFLALDVKPPIS